MSKRVIVRLLWVVLIRSILMASVSHLPNIDIVKPEDNIQIDGDLSDWQNRKIFGECSKQEQVVWGKESWESKEDLSGKFWLGWDGSYLYLAAEVIDDVHSQKNTGATIYEGDHIYLMLDGNRQADVDITSFNSDDLHLGLSPGDFKEGGDFLTKRSAEAFVWMPEYVQTTGIIVMSQKTENGYNIEAAIPWSIVDAGHITSGKIIGIDLGIGDCDIATPTHQTLMSLLDLPWKLRDISRMAEAELAGILPAKAGVKKESSQILASNSTIVNPGERFKLKFVIDDLERENKAPLLCWKSRLVSETIGGALRALKVSVNESAITFDQVINRPSSVQINDGRDIKMGSNTVFTVFYSPDFESHHKDKKSPYYIPPSNFDAYSFIVDLSGILKKGENHVEFFYAPVIEIPNPLETNEIILKWVNQNDAVQIRETFGKNSQSKIVVFPSASFTLPKAFEINKNGSISIVGSKGDRFLFESKYGIPDSRWVTLGNHNQNDADLKINPVNKDKATIEFGKKFKIERNLVSNAECVEVSDTIYNMTGEDLPLIVRHICDLPVSNIKKLTMNGHIIPMKQAITQNAANPTMLIEIPSGGALGLLVKDQVFRIHHEAFCKEGKIGFADNKLVIPAGEKYTQVWQIYDVPSADYWDFINSVRREWNVNFPIEGSFAFINPFEHKNYSVEQLRRYLQNRSAKYAAIMIYDPVVGDYDHGLAFPPKQMQGDAWKIRQQLVANLRQADPNIRILHYFHGYITSLKNGAKDTLPHERYLDSSGKPMTYSIYPDLALYIPAQGSDYEKKISDVFEKMIVGHKIDGIYWDEFEYSFDMYHYGNPWDRCSGDINLQTHQLIRKISAVPLISEPFRKERVKWLQQNNYFLVCNGAPMTEWGQHLKIPRFTETGSLSNLCSTHLYTPIGLADHTSERVHSDTIRSQRAHLENGCLYYYYKTQIDVKNSGIVKWMFPITPVRLGKGFILGEERILTTRSGLFRWDTKKLPPFDVFFVDEEGNQVQADFKVIEKDDDEWVELNLPSNYMAAIVKK